MQSDTEWLASLTRRGWAWELLRRSKLYCEAWKLNGPVESTASAWGLLRFEDPKLDARHASVFWRAEDCPSVLPLTRLANGRKTQASPFALDNVLCRIEFHHHGYGEKTDILFAEEGRFLQVSIEAKGDLKGASLFMPAVDKPENVTARAASFRRFNDLLQHGRLRQALYPREPRAPRLINVLKALDGSLQNLPHREIALMIFSEQRVEAEWGRRQHHLRDKVRRAVAYGESLMEGGYRQFLRPTYSRQIARPGAIRLADEVSDASQ